MVFNSNIYYKSFNFFVKKIPTVKHSKIMVDMTFKIINKNKN